MKKIKLIIELFILCHFSFLSFAQEINLDNKKIFHSKAIGRSTGLTNRIYKVNDIYESFFDIKTGLPYKAIRNINEGNYTSYNEVIYNHKDSSLTSTKSGLIENLEMPIYDILSAFYLIRNEKLKNIKEGETILVNTFFSNKKFPLRIRYMGKENVEIDLGKFECFKFSPVVEAGRVFDTEDDVSIWISADKNFVPIKIQFNLYIGSINCDLKTFKGLKYPLKEIK